MAWGQLSLEDKVRSLWNRKSCTQICDAIALPDTGVEGQLLKVEGVIYYYENGAWLPLNPMEIPLTFTSNAPEQVYTMYAERAFVIDEVQMGTPGTVGIELNGSTYTIGTLVNKYDKLTFTSQGNNLGTAIGHYVNVDFYDIRVSIPVCMIDWSESQTDNIIIVLTNVGNAANTAPITLRLTKADPNFTFTPNTTDSLVLANSVTYAVQNSQFTVSEQATRWNFTTGAGVFVQPGESLWISVLTEATGITGATSSITLSLSTSTSDSNTNNNLFITPTLYIV